MRIAISVTYAELDAIKKLALEHKVHVSSLIKHAAFQKLGLKFTESRQRTAPKKNIRILQGLQQKYDKVTGVDLNGN